MIDSNEYRPIVVVSARPVHANGAVFVRGVARLPVDQTESPYRKFNSFVEILR